MRNLDPADTMGVWGIGGEREIFLLQGAAQALAMDAYRCAFLHV